MSRLQNLVVIAGERYRCQANGTWIKYEPVNHNLYGQPASGICKQRGPWRRHAYFTVRQPQEDGGYVDHVVRLDGASTFRFQDLCSKHDLVFSDPGGLAPLILYVNRDDGKPVGNSPLTRMVAKETA